ncbi:hypothetical protein SO802_002721 [Lithocarpus litseifolius]|uniref:GRF-type domain-containing protein n=1 Tax=Lithocarpus litseifolius TaxID=425828 RepID=A0AAW2DY12_9ROSI
MRVQSSVSVVCVAAYQRQREDTNNALLALFFPDGNLYRQLWTVRCLNLRTSNGSCFVCKINLSFAKAETHVQSSAPSTPQKIHGVKIALIGSHLHCSQSKTHHLFAAPFVAADPSLEYPRPVLIAVDAAEDPRLGFALIGPHLHCPHSKTQQLIQLLSPPTHHPNIQMSDAMHDDIDDGLRFRNSNCFCGMRAIVRISDKRNENRYRLFQCCPKDACRFFQWCIPLKTPLSYAEDVQQLQEELCVLREELRVVHDKRPKAAGKA